VNDGCVRLVKAPGFTVFAKDGTDLGYFRVESEWQGMTRLVNDNLYSLIVNYADGGLADVFRTVFEPKDGLECAVVKASPQILEVINLTKTRSDGGPG
jgi:hypothetical protein